ncbi:MAG: response regulator [bacterium]
MDNAPVLTPPLPRGQVLVVDDDKRSRLTLKAILLKHGHLVTEAADGEAALKAVRLAQPDVILLDVVMPKMDGLEVCRLLKGDPATALIHILMITGETQHETRMKGIECGANDFLAKPVDRDEVLLRVRNAVMAKQLLNELQQRRDEESHDTTLLKNLADLSAGNPGLALAILSVGAEIMSWRVSGGRLTDTERDKLYAVYAQIGDALAKAGTPPA